MENNELESLEDVKTYTQEDVDKIVSENNDRYVRLLAEFDNNNDRYVRLLAEFDNYKKRTNKEKEDIKSTSKISMLNAILDLDSDLSIALRQEVNNPGITLILSKLDKFLSDHGVESIPTDVYDPDNHEVISISEIGEEKVIDVVSKGYSINGKPFRYPKIILGR